MSRPQPRAQTQRGAHELSAFLVSSPDSAFGVDVTPSMFEMADLPARPAPAVELPAADEPTLFDQGGVA